MTLATAITALQTMATTAGAKGAPAYPPESINAFPFSVCYCQSGNLQIASKNFMRGLHTLVMDFYIAPRGQLVKLLDVPGYVQSIHNQIALDPTLGGAVDNVLAGPDSSMTYEVLPVDYAGTTLLCIRFRVGVKIIETAAST